jgi:hypothetical protein
MAKLHAADSRRKVRHRHSLDEERHYESSDEESITLEPDPEEVRRIRVDRLERSADATTETSAAAAPNMTTEFHATIPNSRRSSSQRRRREHHRSPDERRHRRPRDSPGKDEPTDTYVYGPPREKKASRVIVSETRVLGRDGDESSESEKEPVRRSRTVREKPKERKVKVIYVSAKDDVKSAKPRERRIRDSPGRHRSPESLHRSSTHHSRRKSVPDPPPASPPKRYANNPYRLQGIL